MDAVKVATIATVLGISNARVQQLAADGLLPRAGVGLYDIPACVQAFIRHKLVKAKASDATVRSLVAERTRLTKTRADAAEVEVRKLTGELVPVADIEAAWLSVAASLRTNARRRAPRPTPALFADHPM